MVMFIAKRRSLTFVALAIPALCAACIPLPIPHRASVTPLVSGTVLDDVTGEPTAGVSVRVSSSPGIKAEPVLITTDKTGRYEAQVRKLEWWYFVWLGPYDPVCSYSVHVQHPAYEAVQYGETFLGNCSSWTRTRNITMKKRVVGEKKLREQQ